MNCLTPAFGLRDLDPEIVQSLRNIGRMRKDPEYHASEMAAMEPYDDQLCFRGLCEGVFEAYHHKSMPVLFKKFLQLPPELRAHVIHEYLKLEREDGRLSKHVHHDAWGNRCCVWDYPDVLIACDNQERKTFPPPETTRATEGWVPALAFVNRALLGEVTVHMLQNTGQIDLKYIKEVSGFEIATWFREFLTMIPGGLSAVKHLNFPHMHWYNSERDIPAPANPSLELVAVCKNLVKLDITWHSSKLRKPDPDNIDLAIPCTTLDVVNKFRFRPILNCTGLQQVYFNGIHNAPNRGGGPSDLDGLDGLAKWIIVGFLVRRGQKVEIEVARRYGKWRNRVTGTIISLNKKDLKHFELAMSFREV
ncbi:hypothetical protein HBI40_023140 [Parastagonospora nodorum]|nr:hypothetical protein HBI75_050810 [Parastagonospora nodorum]KAH5323412.1 hypothetical protein HBI11_042930 [Parastagonospora nodorum]KAH5485794.1 hypothetical protein HBI31_155600 [Parastagonospora nodorum]KAH5682917.1 hypothetical protein HBI21_038890 [Parastagonospora nodorum]KAH6263544.1 hypothetical protein HBI41_120310 [Parastagonospora nodorum]